MGTSSTSRRVGPTSFLEEHASRVHPLDGRMRVARHLYGLQRPAFRQIVWDDGQECERLQEGRLDRGDLLPGTAHALWPRSNASWRPTAQGPRKLEW